MSRLQNPFVLALVAAVVALGLVAVPVILLNREDAPDETLARVVATTQGTSKIPAVDDERSDEIDGSLDVFLERLYNLAFEPGRDSDAEGEDRTASLLNRFGPLFSDDALEALRGNLELLDFHQLELVEGLVSFEGVVTEADTDSPKALLEVSLTAGVVQAGRASPRADLRQNGTLRVQRVGDGWYVEAFDLRLEIEEIPDEDDPGGDG